MVGVLGIQGSFSLHLRALARLGLAPRLVKRAADLDGCDRLILPGGESTVLSKFLGETGLFEVIRARARANDLALFGTCAGAILIGREPARGPGERPPPGCQPARLALADVEVRRNAYGRQIESFRTSIDVLGIAEDGRPVPFEAVFIRAPRFSALGPGVQVLASLDRDEPVLVRDGRFLLAAFHPELTDDTVIHRYFIERT